MWSWVRAPRWVLLVPAGLKRNTASMQMQRNLLFSNLPPVGGEEKSSSTSLSPPLLLLLLLLPPPPPLLLFSLFVSSCSQTAAEGLPRMNTPCTRGAKRHQWNAQASSSSERNSTSQSRLSAIERGRRGLRSAIAPSVRVQMLK